MSEAFVPGLTTEHATKLLAAAADLGLDASEVRTTEDGFLVPQKVADKVFPPKKAAAKKAPARKAAAKKAPAKAPAKKAPAKAAPAEAPAPAKVSEE